METSTHIGTAQYFADGITTTIKYNASLDDTLSEIRRVSSDTYRQVASLAKELEGATVADTAENIWDYLRENTRYKLDERGKEQLRTPVRSLEDGAKGLTDKRYGIDCDDYTILVSAILKNLGIQHEARVAAYKSKGAFQHIYPVAIDEHGEEYVIDIVPEIPHFNYEQKPIIDLITIPMELEVLSGAGDEEIAEAMLADMANDLADDQNPSIEGIDEDDDDELESSFMYGLGEVETAEEADYVIGTVGELNDVLMQGLLQQLQAAITSLRTETDSPTFLSEIVDIPQELQLATAVLQAWGGEGLKNALSMAGNRSQQYGEFYRGILKAIVEMEQEAVNGLGSLDEEIYLSKVDMEDYGFEDDELGRLRLFRRKKSRGRGKSRFSKFFSRKKGRLKKVFKRIKSGVKRAVKAVVRYNPATVAMRAAILLLIKMNFMRFSEKLAYGLVSSSEAQKRGFDMREYAKAKSALSKAEQFFVKAGGKKANFRKAIKNGRGWKKAGLSGLGSATATAAATASPFIIFMKKLLATINPAKMIKSIQNRRKVSASKAAQIAFDAPMKMNASLDVNTDGDADTSVDPSEGAASGGSKIKQVFSKAKEVVKKHKKPILIGTGVIILIIVGIAVAKKMKKKKTRQLAGAKAARTRRRNAKNAGRSTGGSRSRKPAASGSKSGSKTSNATRLRRMHAKAKQLQKGSPRTKYSTLLKRAAKQI